MKINLSISKRINAQGHSEILLIIRRRLYGKVIDVRGKSGIFIDKKMFDQKKKSVKNFAANKLMTDEVIYHNTQLKRLDVLLCRINEAYNNEIDKNNVCGKWLENVVHSGKKRKEKESKKNVYQLFDDYLHSKPRSSSTVKTLRSYIHSVARYEMYVQLMGKRHKNFTFDVDTITKKDIEDYRDYISNEKRLSEEQPNIFKRINNGNIRAKGGNSVSRMIINLKSFFIWLNREKITDNKPFDNIEFGKEQYGTPYYITIEERNKIASTPMPTKYLETQRDIFIFQCLIGCRISDLARIFPGNITKNILVYTPRKTKEVGMQALQARVPLHPIAIKIVEKYKNVDERGRLLPFTNIYKYNKAIREIFTIAGITRSIEVRNTLNGEIEIRPINEVASSHLARRTFVGNLYSKVADPNLIAKMSGHVDGSKAFARYRKIEDETLKSVIKLL